MKLIKTTILSAISTLIKTGTVFLITKVIAITGGPIGLATVGQLQNFINIFTLTAGGSLNTAVVKYTASLDNDKEALFCFWRTTLTISLILSVSLSSLLFCFSNRISEIILNSNDYAYIFIVFSISLPFFVLNLFFLAVLNGLKKINEFILLSIMVSVLSLFIVCAFSLLWGFDGALLSYVTNQSLVFFISFFYIKKKGYLDGFLKEFKIDKKHIYTLLSFSTITFTAVLSSNLSMVFIREHLNDSFTPSSAGYWQGIWQLSQVVLSMFVTTFSTYLLPKLSEAKGRRAILSEIISSIKVIVPCALISLLIMYISRDYIICTLYSKAFMPMSDLFLWQLIGTGIKVVGWLFGYVLVSKAMVKYTVMTELIFAFSLCLFIVIFTKEFGLIGTTYAFAINSFIHFLSMFFIFYKKVLN